MKAVVQRVSSAGVVVEQRTVGSIENGLMVLLGISQSDDVKDMEYIAKKIVNLRIFDDEEGVMNLSLLDKGYPLLLVSQFTLCANTRKGNRPSYVDAARPEAANEMYEKMISHIKAMGVEVQTGQFQAHMEVQLVNDGPVTILLDSRD